MELTKELIRKIASEAMKEALGGFNAAFPEATAEEKREASCVTGPVAAAIVAVALYDPNGGSDIISALLGEK